MSIAQKIGFEKLYGPIGILVLMLFGSPPVEAWEIGKVKGSGEIVRSGLAIPVSKGIQLELGDLLVTKKRSRVLLKEAGSRIWIGSGSKFKIKASKRTSKTKAEDGPSVSLTLLYGKVRASIGKATARKYNYKTKTAVAGVRGTEFFFASNESQDLFCTLEGSIDVATSDGASIKVGAGQGLKLSSGHSPELATNSKALVDLWVAQTSFSDVALDMDAYSFEKKHHQLASGQFSYGAFGWVYWCKDRDKNFGQAWQGSTDNATCTRATLSPFIQYGKQNKIMFRPAIYHVSNDFVGLIDDFPHAEGKELTSVAVAELYGEMAPWGWKFRLGVQSLQWADGVLLSFQNWGNEPKSHLALRVMGHWQDWGIEFLAGPGVREGQPLKGLTHIKTLGLKLDAPKDWASFYYLHANFGDIEPGLSPYVHGHEINNLGIYSVNKIKSWDYRFSVIYQKHVIHHDASRVQGQVEGSMFEAGVGYHFGTNIPMRVSFRDIHASENFIPILDDYYKLGVSGIVATRANLKQHRIKFEIDPVENHSIWLEYLLNREVSADGFVRHLSATTDKAEIGNELNLTYRVKWGPQWELMGSYWEFYPSKNQPGNSKATGYIARAAWSY